MSDYLQPPPPYPPPQPHPVPPPVQPPAASQPSWPAPAASPQAFGTRTDQRVHQLAWSVFWLLMSGVAAVLAVITSWTIVGAVVFGLAALALWVVALIYSIMALSRR